MRKFTASDGPVKDGIVMSPNECPFLLDKMNGYDPSIRDVFHMYVEDKLSSTRKLVTSRGRERIFLGLGPRGDNSRIVGKAYAYLPQSAVGDNTGMAILFLDSVGEPIVHDGHDSVILETDDNEETVKLASVLS